MAGRGRIGVDVSLRIGAFVGGVGEAVNCGRDHVRDINEDEDNDEDELVEIISDENVIFSLYSLASELVKLEDERGLLEENTLDGLKVSRNDEEDGPGRELPMVRGGGKEEVDGNVDHVKFKSTLRCVGI